MKRISPRLKDPMIAAVVFLIAGGIGIAYVATYDPVPYFLQHMFGPAVMWACGRGFENPKLSDAPGLEGFLYGRSPCFDCAELPPDLAVAPEDPFSLTDAEWRDFHPHPEFAGWVNCQQFHGYMLRSAAVLWRVFGVSWTALLPLYGFLYGTAGAAAYGLFRLAMKRPLAGVLALLFVLAPLQLQQLPDLRDYAKAPFFIAAIGTMGAIAARPLRPRTVLALSALCGAGLGLGVGFRQDVLIAVPVFILSSTFFLHAESRIPKPEFIRHLIPPTVFLASFVIVGWPILNVLFTQANNSSHDTLIGFSRYFDDRLRVGSPLYDFGDPFLDEYTRAAVESFHYRTAGGVSRLRHYTRDYDEAASSYFRAIATTFPADLVTRAYAAILRVLDELRPARSAPRGIEQPALVAVYKAHGVLMDSLLACGRYAAALALMLLAARNLRQALFALFVLCWFAGYPSLRFSVRHAFYLQIIPVFISGFLLQRAIDLAPALYHRRLRMAGLRQTFKTGVIRAAAFVVVAAAALLIPLAALRTYQDRQVTKLFQAYLDAPHEPLEYQLEPSPSDGETLVHPYNFPPQDAAAPQLPIYTEMLRLELAGVPDHIRLIYAAADPMYDFSRVIPVETSRAGSVTGTLRVFIPLYHNATARFVAIAVPASATLGLRVDRVKTIPTPVLVTAVLPENWRSLPAHYEIKWRR